MYIRMRKKIVHVHKKVFVLFVRIMPNSFLFLTQLCHIHTSTVSQTMIFSFFCCVVSFKIWKIYKIASIYPCSIKDQSIYENILQDLQICHNHAPSVPIHTHRWYVKNDLSSMDIYPHVSHMNRIKVDAHMWVALEHKA